LLWRVLITLCFRHSDFLFKVVLVGDSGVGKSSILLRFTEDSFNTSHMPTIGVDFKLRTIQVSSKTIKLQIWDTAGQERFRTISSSYYRGSHGVMIVYDICDKMTLEHAKTWLSEVERHGSDHLQKLLVGNKSDLVSRREVETSTAQQLAESLGMSFVEVSANTGDDIERAFLLLAEKIHSMCEDSFFPRKTRRSRLLTDLLHTRVGHLMAQPRNPNVIIPSLSSTPIATKQGCCS